MKTDKKINLAVVKSQMMLISKKEFIQEVKNMNKDFMKLENNIYNANKRLKLKRLYQWACKHFYVTYGSHIDTYL
ncbi:hypothetical protein [Mesonia sp. K7]|uniref:hypothetical protein n=1 Tax=Mesonia sp. K7 TaxID=2218606 RepID=UPI000DAAB120|nr:hypothetical protein [Mesonia sp. K7]PZD76723.1 hypothetical protein DNG35_11245 [Mesonia sp. K7]